MRRVIAVAAVAALALTPLAGVAEEPPLPETGFLGTGTPGGCLRPDPDDPTKTIDPYGAACVRLKFAYGPIIVQPGDNDTQLNPVAIEKPWYDGYMVGIAPNLVRGDGSVPAIEDIHLHHATWLSSPSYGNGPFFAAGEEKTIARFPHGYGMPVARTDVWYFVSMIHNEGTAAEAVWVTYHVDYVSNAAAAQVETPWGKGLRPIKPFWLDVWKNGDRANYPVYNTQRGYGSPITDPVTLDIIRDPQGEPWASAECTWPRDTCADHDSWSGSTVGQGAPGNGKGTDIYTTANMAGTLIGIGGHLHPGGTRVEVDAVRCTEGPAIRPGNTISSWTGLRCPDVDADGVAGEEAARIFTSDAVYFDGKPVSWNFSMTVTGFPSWSVNLDEGWMLRINSVYETSLSNWYENMGIAVAYVVPKTTTPLFGVDPFTATVDNRPADVCRPEAGPTTICARGTITHGPLAEAGNPGGAYANDWEIKPGVPTDQITIGGFRYEPGDLAEVEIAGVPLVDRDRPLTFWNADAAANIFHTVTGCSYPCSGSTGIAYPLADFGHGASGAARPPGAPVAYDSSELGFSPDFGPAKGQIKTTSGSPVPSQPATWAQAAVSYTVVPAQLGLEAGDTYTYFCRVHPFMRGAFTVVD